MNTRKDWRQQTIAASQLFLWSIEPLPVSDQVIDIVEKRMTARMIAKEIVSMQNAIDSGEANAADPVLANKRNELTAALANATLTDSDIAELFGSQGQGASLQKPKSAGQIAYNSASPGDGNAAAGRTVVQ